LLPHFTIYDAVTTRYIKLQNVIKKYILTNINCGGQINILNNKIFMIFTFENQGGLKLYFLLPMFDGQLGLLNYSYILFCIKLLLLNISTNSFIDIFFETDFIISFENLKFLYYTRY